MPLSTGQVSVSLVLQMVKLRHKEVKQLAQGCAVNGDRSRIRAASSWLAEAPTGCWTALPSPAEWPCVLLAAELSHLQGKSSCPLSTIKSLNVLGFFFIYGFSFNCYFSFSGGLPNPPRIT